MHASGRPSEPLHALRSGDEGVSEVVGQILMFGILSMVLIMTLFSFNVAKDAAEERVLDTTTASVAQRVASLVVDTALFAESFQDDGLHMESRIDLPGALETRSYTIDLEANAVEVHVPGSGTTARAPLFSAGSPNVVHVCDQDPIDGGSVRIFTIDDATFAAQSPDCDVAAGSASFYIYLEPVQ